MLACTGLGDDALLAHARGQQRLADGVVDLVRAGVVQVLALEQDLRATDVIAQALGVIDRARPAHVMRQVAVIGRLEFGVLAGLVIGLGQFLQRADQGFGNEAAAVAAEVALGIRESVVVGNGGGRHGYDRWFRQVDTLAHGS